jgi:hypothetical protein
MNYFNGIKTSRTSLDLILVTDSLLCTSQCFDPENRPSRKLTPKAVCSVSIQTNGLPIPDLSMNAECHREQALYHSVRKSKVLQMLPSEEV